MEKEGRSRGVAHRGKNAFPTKPAPPLDSTGRTVDRVVRAAFVAASTLVFAYLISLVARPTGSNFIPIDGWAVAGFEVLMGVLVIGRYFDGRWRAGNAGGRVFPLVLGLACVSWGVGDFVLTIESIGGATPSVPSAADVFYVSFFPLCYLGFSMLMRRGNRATLVTTSLDGLVVGLGAAALAAAFAFNAVLHATGGSKLGTATNMVYPLGDVLLFALAVGCIFTLPKAYARFFSVASIAVVTNTIGDSFNLLQPNTKIGYIANGIAWPLSITLLAIATWVQPAKVDRRGSDKTSGFLLPVLGAVAALLILGVASVSHIGKPAVGLATATLLAAGVRLMLAIREAQAMKSARFRSLIDRAWDLIAVTEVDLRLAFVTPSAERVLGCQPDELRGRPLTELVHPDDASAAVDALAAVRDAPTEAAAFEVRMQRSDGDWRTIAWTATNLLDDPSVNGYVLNGSDVTEIRQSAADLVAARDAALLASRTKSQFVSTMSHEIRTPMNGVIGLTELLLETELDTNQHELASGVKVSAESLLVIINDILDFSKIEAGKLEIEESALDVASVLDAVGRILAGPSHQKGLELLVDIHPDVPAALLGDATRIQQVLLNLGSNAIKFTSEGEVVLRARVLHESAERVALHFEVVDQGIGIAPADQERLFSAFAQADSSTTRRYGGTGLGLTICRQLVELMGGKLGVTSVVGEGSTFWIELSLRRAEGVASNGSSRGPRTLTGQRALIVDDNATNRRILRQQLHSWGVEAMEAADGFEALELASVVADEGRAFDLGVVDLNMPGMDGIELARALKADQATAATILFLLSSSGNRLGEAESHLNGFAASLTKPVRSSELFDCLVTSLNAGVRDIVPTSTQTEKANPQEVPGMILLVEDNKVNQLVGSKVLQQLGYRYDIANNGVEAVRAVESAAYDAVLMDCQMPEMDGYEATAAIRRLEATDRHTPIIAMTAAAMEEDRDRCLAAGMDDFITKPVRLDVVSTVLERWMSQPGRAREGEVSSAASVEARSDPLDQSQIELLRSLDDGEGGALLEIIDEYLRLSLEGRTELLRVLDLGDIHALERAAHTLKGASINVGASALADICAEIEMHARMAQLEGAAELIDRFEAEFSRARRALRGLRTRT